MTGDPSSDARIPTAFDYGTALATSLAFALLAPAAAAHEPDARLSAILVSDGDAAPADRAVQSLADLTDVILRNALSDGRCGFSLPLPPPSVAVRSWTSKVCTNGVEFALAKSRA